MMGKPDWEPLRVAKDGCGLPTVSNTVDELAVMMAGLASEKDDDWIWDAMTKNPDLVGGFNRLDSTCLKAGEGKILAKEGADGLLGLSVDHPDWPDGLGIVIKIVGTVRLLGTLPELFWGFWELSCETHSSAPSEGVHRSGNSS